MKLLKEKNNDGESGRMEGDAARCRSIFPVGLGRVLISKYRLGERTRPLIC